jgi:hypothetical protein
MTRSITRSVQFLFLLAMSAPQGLAQLCTPLTNATPGPTLLTTAGGNDNRSAVAFHPDAQLYYSLDAGSPGYPADTYDAEGNYLTSIAQGFDYRGAWWNPATGQLEGNGYLDLGIFVQNLDAVTHYPTGTGTVILFSAQPDAQSVGALDPEADEIVHYFNGSIHRYARATNASLGTIAVTGLPVSTSSLNSNSIAFTGCEGYEFGLYDFTNRQVLFVDKSTGAYSGFCQLPQDAPQRAMFGMSYSNGYFWLFDAPPNPGTWRSYRVLDLPSGDRQEHAAIAARVYPVPASDALQIEWQAPLAVKDMRVLDPLGRYVSVPSAANGAQKRQFDVSHLGVGTYYLEIVTDQGTKRSAFVVAR